MSFPLPKKYYLLVHDAIRKAVGTEAEISAFVKSKGRFQCDMLVNSTTTDPELAGGGDDVGGSKGAGNNNTNGYVRDFAMKLQRHLGSCDVVVHRQRLDLVFMDREVLQLALGAPQRAINNLQSAEEINREPEWTRRNRLRISLGYDEDLFSAACDLKTNLAARMMEKWVFDNYCSSEMKRIIKKKGKDNEQSSGMGASEMCRLQEQFPPVTYWQVHGYLLGREYRVDHHVGMLGTIAHNFAKYYGEFPLDNPYCPGEDLNTIACVQTLCKAWKQLPLDEGGAECMLQLGMQPLPPSPSS